MRFWIVAGLVALAACAPAPAPTATPAVTLRAWPPPVPAGSTPGPAAATPVIIASPTPSATPMTHTIVQGETLISVAVDYGVGLADLQAANPHVVPELLSVGTVLVIPVSGEAPVVPAGGQPTPMPVTFGAPTCRGLANGALYCFVEARNPGGVALEAVAARITLAGPDGRPLAEALAEPAVGVLPPGDGIPLIAFFAAAPAGYAAIGVTAATALPLTEAGQRYRVLSVTVAGVDLAGPAARVTGTVRNLAAEPATARVALALYDQADALSAVRWLTLDGVLAPDESRAFTLEAPGPASHYRIWGEGRP